MKTPLPRRTHTRIVALMVILGFLLSVSSASAHRLGGQFPHTAGSWLYLGYTTSGAYSTQAVNAAASWHYTPTRLVVFQESYANSELDFYTQNRTETWWGLTVHHRRPDGATCLGGGSACSYYWADLYLNSRTLASQSTFIRQKVAAHEFGHGFGLAHTTDWWYSSIMKQGSLSYNLPRTHDINDANAIYR